MLILRLTDQSNTETPALKDSIALFGITGELLHTRETGLKSNFPRFMKYPSFSSYLLYIALKRI